MGNDMSHGMHNTSTYHVWENMKQRCLNSKHPSFLRYGARGINICDEWLAFENFYRDMGEKPENFTLERKNNNDGYRKSNCVWATRAEQSDNLSTCRKIEYNGKTQSIGAWAREYQLSHGVLWNRLMSLGWEMKRALNEPPRILKGKNNV